MQRRNVLLAVAIAVLATKDHAVAAAEFRAPLPGLTFDSQPGADYRASAFDFGVGFRRIDSVSLAIYVPNGFGGVGVTKNILEPSLDLLITRNLDDHDIEEMLRPPSYSAVFTVAPTPPPPPPNYIKKSFAANNLDILMEPGVDFEDVNAFDLSYYNGQPEQIVPIAVGNELSLGLFDIISTGKGEVALGARFSYLMDFFPSHPVELPTVTSAYLLISGVPIPEPSSLSLLTTALVGGFGSLRRFECDRVGRHPSGR